MFENEKALELKQRHLSQRVDFGEEFYPLFFFSYASRGLIIFRTMWWRGGDVERINLFY
ncbi:hypothetical protein [Azospirillum argentinense]